MLHAHAQTRHRGSPAAPARVAATPTAAGPRQRTAFGAGARHLLRKAAPRPCTLAALGLVALLAGCGGSTPPTPTAVTPAAITPAATARPQAPIASPTPALPAAFSTIGSPVAGAAGEIGDVVWARSVDPATKAPVDRTTSFPPDAPAIYAVVPVVRLAPNARLTASWSYNDTSLDAFTQTVTAGGESGARWVEFHITRSSSVPWPAGDYTIVVRLADGVAQTASVTVSEAS
jgi:hypothetical protein